MQAGGITETIWHFIGYFHLADSVARTPTVYEGDQPPTVLPESHDAAREPLRGLAFDELVSVPTQIREGPMAEPNAPAVHALAPAITSISTKALPALPPVAKPLPAPVDHTGFGLPATPRLITAEYGEGGNEGLLQIRQVNLQTDRDLVTSDEIRYADGRVVVPQELQLDGTVATAMAQANAVAPDGLPDMNTALVSGTSEIVAQIAARDALWAETGSPYADGSQPGTLPEGRIVDGVVGAPEPHVPALADSAPWRQETSVKTVSDGSAVHAELDLSKPTGGVATIAETGLNVQINVAAIVDLNEATGSMMVGGNYFYSRGIVQANVLVDNDTVDVAVSGQLSPQVQTGGNEVHNIAEFITHQSTIAVRGAAATPHWTIDVVQGDFYDVKSIVQFNGMDDNDRTVQAESGTYYNLGTGGNKQINLTEVTGFDRYDIIVIGGDYHRANWIYQYNIMVDPDYATLYSTGDAGDDTTVTTGFNNLVNRATIESIDAPDFKTMQDAHHELMDMLAGGATVLVPSAEWQLYGSAMGSLKVLYVSGDYYDVNTITQVNVMVDGDQSIQASATAGTQQGVAAGGNSAVNDAYIGDPGLLSTSNYLGGVAYEEAMLIQVNIVTDSDTVTIHDTSTLVPELVAFATNATQEPEPDCRPAPLLDPAQHDHVTSNILV
jgi:hypothetical protein